MVLRTTLEALDDHEKEHFIERLFLSMEDRQLREKVVRRMRNWSGDSPAPPK
jgi:hypothetical protein